MSSVDGRLIDGRWSDPYKAAHADLLKVYSAAGRELNTDAWMFGKNTLRAMFPYKFSIKGNTVAPDSPAVYNAERTSERMFIVADPEADIYFTSSTVMGDNILVILGRNVTEEYLAHLRELHISYVIVSNATSLKEGFNVVGREFGIRSVSVQGGGILNGALLADRLIDELSLVIYPGIDGLSGVPSVCEYIGGMTDHPAEKQRLQLLSAAERHYR